MPESDLGWLWRPLSAKMPLEEEAHREEEEEEEEGHPVRPGKDP
jgi:hypothetical protein